MEKKFRVIQTTICEEHTRVSVILVDTALNPIKHIISSGQGTVLKRLPNGRVGQVTPLAAMDLHHHRGYITLDLTPEEYEKLGSPTVGQTMDIGFKAGKM